MGWFSKLVYGVDLDEEQQRGDSLDAALKDLNQKDYGPGGRLYDAIAEERGPAAAIVAYQDVQKNLATSSTGNVTDQVEDEFYSSLDESTAGTRKAIGGIVGSVFGVIPLSVWLLAGVALFIYMGGWVWLKGRLLK